MFPSLEAKLDRYEELEQQLQQPEIATDPNKFIPLQSLWHPKPHSRSYKPILCNWTTTVESWQAAVYGTTFHKSLAQGLGTP